MITPGPESIPVFARVLGLQVESNRVTREELDRFEADLTEAAARGAFTLALTMFVAAGTVPPR